MKNKDLLLFENLYNHVETQTVYNKFNKLTNNNNKLSDDNVVDELIYS